MPKKWYRNVLRGITSYRCIVEHEGDVKVTFREHNGELFVRITKLKEKKNAINKS